MPSLFIDVKAFLPQTSSNESNKNLQILPDQPGLTDHANKKFNLEGARIMNTTAIYSSDHTWSRRCSTETILSIQGKETDFARDTSDTDALSDTEEYEPCTEPEDEAPVDGDTSEQSDNEIISTKVIEVSVGDDGDLVFADSERTDDTQSDSELDFFDYWHCAQCRAVNNNPTYRYCQKCFQVRKSFFPPRPRRKHKRERPVEFSIPHKREKPVGISIPHIRDEGIDPDDRHESDAELPRASSQDLEPVRASSQDSVPVCASSQDSEPARACSQGSEPVRACSQDSGIDTASQGTSQDLEPSSQGTSFRDEHVRLGKKRRGKSPVISPRSKLAKYSNTIRDKYNTSDSDDDQVTPLIKKTVSDPSITIENVKVTKRVIADTLKEIETKDLCVICVSEPKSGVFVHGRLAHICCCYKCAVKVWSTAKRCPVCNCKVSNVLRAVVM